MTYADAALPPAVRSSAELAVVNEGTKNCCSCGEQKALSDYHRDGGAKDGHSYRCKACVRAAGKAWREQNAERKRTNAKAYYEANKARVLEQQRAYWQATKQERLATAKRWAEAHPHSVSASKKRWQDKHGEAHKLLKREQYRADPDTVNMRNKAWRDANPEKVKAYRERLSDAYVASMLGLRTDEAPAELLQMKRDQVALRRLARLLKEACNEDEQDS